ncbi:MAG TPA: hypothetical protein VMU54_13940 [Planctomycetota bacterium]|nr:hypothetical protein [Planctomycetota bacterium]
MKNIKNPVYRLALATLAVLALEPSLAAGVSIHPLEVVENNQAGDVVWYGTVCVRQMQPGRHRRCESFFLGDSTQRQYLTPKDGADSQVLVQAWFTDFHSPDKKTYCDLSTSTGEGKVVVYINQAFPGGAPYNCRLRKQVPRDIIFASR